MSEQPSDKAPYFRAPRSAWSDVNGGVWEGLVELRAALDAALDTTRADRPPPLELALKLNEIAQGIFEQLAPEERSLRQVISTLRTGHAVAWDMYDAVQATRVTVEQLMKDLRDKIDSFESDLGELQKEQAA